MEDLVLTGSNCCRADFVLFGKLRCSKWEVFSNDLVQCLNTHSLLTIRHHSLVAVSPFHSLKHLARKIPVNLNSPDCFYFTIKVVSISWQR